MRLPRRGVPLKGLVWVSGRVPQREVMVKQGPLGSAAENQVASEG